MKKWDSLLVSLAGAAALTNAAAWAILFWKIPQQQDTLLLHYNIYFGPDRSGTFQELLWMPGSGLIILLLNGALVFALPRLHRFIKILVLALTIAMQLMLVVAAVLVVLLNG